MKKTLFTLLSLVSLASCSEDPAYLSKEKMGAAWPFTTESVLVGCDAGRTFVQAPDGKKYGLNGLASGARGADGEKMYSDLNDIWLPDPANGPGGHKDLLPVLAAAEKQCSK